MTTESWPFGHFSMFGIEFLNVRYKSASIDSEHEANFKDCRGHLSVEYGEITKICKQAEQAGKLGRPKMYFCTPIENTYFDSDKNTLRC